MFGERNLGDRATCSGKLDDDPVFAEYLDDRLFCAEPVDPARDIVQHSLHLVQGRFVDDAGFKEGDRAMGFHQGIVQAGPSRVVI